MYHHSVASGAWQTEPVKRWLLKYSGQPQKSNQNHTHTHTHTNQSKEFLVTEPQNQELVYGIYMCVEIDSHAVASIYSNWFVRGRVS